MGLHKKHGKGRLDKWYKLAKEKGYRARAAFKLIQLNKKYGFLEKSKVLIDLCAAPGSWCQVAAETMPVNSLIIGVDLAPIKSIPRTITFQSDITTDKCRTTIRQHLKTWKADTVLHDGAPNVGTAWVQDAFTQAELALQAMKLATEFLAEGGTFVTKVFRSKDYNSLMWVFNQLFAKVEATKPPASRNVSAEIFVVCRGFKAPKRIDSKFLDPRSVFAELPDPTPNNEAKVFNPEKKKRKRDGYAEGDHTQFKEAPVTDFIQTTDPIAMLGSLNKLSFEHNRNGDIALAALEKLPETTREIQDCCADLKVLGRKEFRSLLKWRLKMREVFGLALKKPFAEENNQAEEVAEVAPMDEELRIQEELQRLNEQESGRRKRERRRENERKQKEIVRMQLRMTAPSEIGLEQSGPNGEDAMFALKIVDKAGVLDKVVRGKMNLVVAQEPEKSRNSGKERQTDDSSKGEGEGADPEGDLLERELDSMYQQYQERRSVTDARYRAKKARKEHEDGEWEGFSGKGESSGDNVVPDESSEDSSDAEEPNNLNKPLITTLATNDVEEGGLTRQAAIFFNQDIFRDINGLNDTARGNDYECTLTEKLGSLNERSSGLLENTKYGYPPNGRSVKSKSNTLSKPAQAGRGPTIRESTSFELVKSTEEKGDWEGHREPQRDGQSDIDIITAEAMTLAQDIASGKKTQYDLIDEGYNKYAFRDKDGLPEWFLDDENKHSIPHRPITAAGAAAIKEKLRALNARPIKKVREAKDRKKFKAAQRLERLRKKSALLADDEGMTEKEKASNIAKIMSKVAKKPKQQVKVVVARGGNKGISGRPRGVKGKYKIVDARLKKDVRAEKRIAKKRNLGQNVMGFFDHFHKDGTAALKPQTSKTRKEVVKSAQPPSSSSISPTAKHSRSPVPANSKPSNVQLRDTTGSRKSVADGKQERAPRLRKRASPLQNRLVSSSDDSDSGEAEIQPRKRIRSDRVEEKRLIRSLRCEAALVNSNDDKFTFLHAADIAALGLTNNYMAAFGDSSEVEISLQYPSGSQQERYQLVHPRDNEDFNPVDDMIRVIELVSTFYLLPEQAEPLLDENSGIIRKLRRALARRSAQEFREGVLRYNQIIKNFRDNGTISKNLDEVHTLPLPLVERILTQTYARTVSLQVSALKKYENGSDNVYGELLPRFISKIFHDTRLRPDQVFVDLGSGVGNVVLQAALETGCESWGCEMMENACELAERQEKEFTARCRLWGLAIGNLKLERGDFLKNHNIAKILKRADVVLVNNQAFTPELNNGLMNLFLDLREGCQIVSLKSFVPHDHKITSRNFNSPVHLLNVERKEYFSDSVSWTNAPGTYFVARKDGTKLKEFLDRMG